MGRHVLSAIGVRLRREDGPSGEAEQLSAGNADFERCAGTLEERLPLAHDPALVLSSIPV